MRFSITILITTVMLFSIGCAEAPESAKGFRLPDGDPDVGKDVFIELDCHACHTIEKLELPPAILPWSIQVNLGGEVTKVKTYGELVSSIINPSHKISTDYPLETVFENGKSLMADYNHEMTVQELIYLVAFLQDQYDIVLPEYQPIYGP